MKNGRYCGIGHKLCPWLLFSDGVTFTGGNLEINITLPNGETSLPNHAKRCIVVTDAIPDETTRVAPVVITINGGTELYPLVNQCGAQVTQRVIDSRARYSVEVVTSATSAVFRLLGKVCPDSVDVLGSIDGTAPTEGGAAA